ncbi:hypothetical protein [Bacillus ndiopicus]|uniref:hypothetical protein n=1 Tax=Bacillus ndiopicus TaxID=1347368 RepID=UPI000B03F8A4|nr:hypothetical protein [Bacillus ndiopicus]
MDRKANNKKLQNEEFGQDLSPDDLDTRNENEMTKEQVKNTPIDTTSNNKSHKTN